MGKGDPDATSIAKPSTWNGDEFVERDEERIERSDLLKIACELIADEHESRRHNDGVGGE